MKYITLNLRRLTKVNKINTPTAGDGKTLKREMREYRLGGRTGELDYLNMGDK